MTCSFYVDKKKKFPKKKGQLQEDLYGNMTETGGCFVFKYLLNIKKKKGIEGRILQCGRIIRAYQNRVRP
jgi:hypothetical protein